MNLWEGPRQFLYNAFSSQASKYHGLLNQGATCYLNSVLHVLFMTKDFREAVERYADENPASQFIDHHLKALFSDLQKYSAYTYNITRALGINNVYEQRDAAEYFERILRLTSGDASQIFHGRLSHQTTCCKCGEKTVRDEAFWHLPLALVDSCSDSYRVVDGIRTFFETSVFSGENQMYCDRCDTKVDATAKYVMKHHPDVLILLLKRFEFSYLHMSYVKISREVDVPSIIQIPERQMYELYAVVDHFGDLRGGHYTATIKDEDEDRWYNFDDSRVTLSEYQPFQLDDTEKSCTAHLLFYRKKNDNVSTNGGVTLASIENHDQLEAAEMMGQRGGGDDDVEMGDGTTAIVSVGQKITEIEDTVRDVSRGIGLSEEPGIEVSVRQTGPYKNQEDDYLLDVSVNRQEGEEGTQMGEDEEGKREKAEADDETENARLLSVETKHEGSITYNENEGVDRERERMLDANFKSDDSVRPEICDHLNQRDETSDAQSRVLDEMTGDKQSEKPLIDYLNREAEHCSEGGLDRQNRNEDQDSNLKTGEQFDPGHVDKHEDEKMRTIYDLCKSTKDQHRRGDGVEEKMPNSDPEYKQGSSSRLDKKHKEQREEERRYGNGNDEQKRRDQDHARKENKYDRNETPDHGRAGDAPQSRRKNTSVECVGVEEKGGVETVRYLVRKDGGAGESTRSKAFENQDYKREISHTVGRHVEDNNGGDGEQGQRKGSARKCSEGGKSNDSGRLEGTREKDVKKQTEEKEDKGEQAQFYNREDSGPVGTVRRPREKQESGGEQMRFHNKGRDNQPDVESAQHSVKEDSEEHRGPAKTNKQKRSGSQFLSFIKIKKSRTEASEEPSNSSHHGENTDSLTKSVSSLMLTELAVPESKKRRIWKVKIKGTGEKGKRKPKKKKEKSRTPGCFSFSRSRKSPEQSGEED